MVTATPLSEKIAASEQRAIQTLVTQLLERFPAEMAEIILFGSKARGDSEADSDIDILVLVNNETWKLRTAIWDVAATLELDFERIVFNILVIGLERWRQMSEERFSLCRNVERDGILLYRREGVSAGAASAA